MMQRLVGTEERLLKTMHALHKDAIERAAAGDAETRTFMRVLHEEVLSRIATIGEHQTSSGRRHPPRIKR
jgi:hypothetical protein